MSEVASIVKHQPASFEFTQEQSKMIRDSFLNGASEAEASVLMELARIRRLNPITRQIHFVKRWDSQKSREVWAAQVGIDGFRTIAERTGLYDGQDEPEFEYEKDGAIKLCRVKIYRKDWSRPAVGVAHFSEYVGKKRDHTPTEMWSSKRHIMIAKCAEALAFRKAFPEDTSGLYTAEEMSSLERDVTPPAVNGSATAALKAKVIAAKDAALAVAPKDQPETAELINVVAGEDPPPPDDSDAPWQREPGDDGPESEAGESAEVGESMKFGSCKDKPLSTLTEVNLNWYAKVLAENIANPAKARYRDSAIEQLAGIQREQAQRTKQSRPR